MTTAEWQSGLHYVAVALSPVISSFDEQINIGKPSPLSSEGSSLFMINVLSVGWRGTI